VIGVALKGLAGRKLRAALTAIAIVLGVAMVSGTYVLTDTIDKAFSNIFQESYAGTDVVVSGRAADIEFQGLAAEAPPIPADLLDEVRALPNVEEATGSVLDQTNTKILTKDGKAVNTQGAPSLGFGIDPAATRFNPLRLQDGRWPQADDEVVIDAGTAEAEGYAIGDTIEVATLEPVRDFRLAGVAQYGDVSSLGTATFAVFTIPAAQELLHREGKYDAIAIAAGGGAAADELAREVAAALPESVQVRTGEQQADKDLETVEFTKFIRYFLLAFAGVALFVGAFVIFNTFSITVAQRTREFATLRTVGASRRQLLWSVVLEALVIGVVASVIGLFGGLGLAKLLNALFVALSLDLPTAGTVFATRTIVVSLLIGTVVTLVAGLFPAIRATRVPPIAAVREGAVVPKSRLAPFAPYIALVTIALAVALLSFAMFRDELDTAARLLSIAGGVLLLFTGVALVSSNTVRPLAIGTSPIAIGVRVLASIVAYPVTLAFWLIRYGLFSRPATAAKRLAVFVGGVALLAAFVVVLALLAVLFGIPGFVVGFLAFLLAVAVLVFAALWGFRAAGRFEPEWPAEFPNVRPDLRASGIAKENARRNTGRTAATAAALMIGIALVTFVGVLANGMKASNRGAIEDQVRADYVLTAQDGFTPFVAGAGEALEEAGGTELVTPVRAELGEVAGSGQYVTGIEPEEIALAYTFTWQEGSDAVLASLGRDGAIVAKDFAEDHDLVVGSTFPLVTPDETRVELEVKGIYEPPPFYPLLGVVSIDRERFDSLYERARNQFVFANVPGEPTEATTVALEAAVAEFPDAKVQTRGAWITQQDKDFNQFLNMLYVLLALSVVVSLFGMVNTLVLSVFERTRELGMLRAVGMTRRQARRMIRHESVITALIGATLGLPLGIFLALLVTKALSQFDVQFAVPFWRLVLFAVVAIVVGIFAAILPARRAARLNVLRALQYE
jgi:putative ABC transport system permease protein